jgi:hypothetical protein
VFNTAKMLAWCHNLHHCVSVVRGGNISFERSVHLKFNGITLVRLGIQDDFCALDRVVLIMLIQITSHKISKF